LQREKLTLRHRNILVVLVLVTVLFVSLFLAVEEFSVPAQSSDPQFFFGFEIGWRANATECKAVIDEVKNYTNFVVIANSVITCDEAALNETCDYAYDADLYFMVYFSSQLHSGYERDIGNSIRYYPFIWIMEAKERYGDRFLGAYYDDEPGGHLLDSGRTPIYTNPYTTQSYKAAASSFVQSTSENMDVFSYLGQRMDVSLFTSDYGLYWFDYKAGYDVVLAHFAWNNSRPLQVALCRGAAKVQNRDWGIIMTWTYMHPPYMESADELYDDMVLAYNSGAKYVAVYDASDDWQNSTFTEDHFDALKNFWEYVQQNPDKHGSLKADTVLVLPADYGFGFRNQNDTIWGYTLSDMWSRKIYDDVHDLLDEYGSSLDIVYSDPAFNDAIANNYSNVLTWTTGNYGDSYPVVNLNNTMGYSTIQEAINSFATYNGHTIFVKSGTYNENVVVGKSISLVGEDEEATIICGDNNDTALNIICSGVNVTGFTIRDGGNGTSGLGGGICLTNADNCSISRNTVAANNYGVYLQDSANNTLRNNKMFDNVYNFGVSGHTLSDYVNDVDSSNTVNGKAICYWVNKHDRAVPSDVGYVALVNCTDISAQNLRLANNYNGLLVAYTQNSTITDNTLTSNWEGIGLDYSSGNILTGNDMHDNICNFWVNGELANSVDATNRVDGKSIVYWINQHNRIVPSDSGYVALINCTGITVQNLQLSNNRQGILLINTRNTTITQNTITNQIIGIELDSASNNTITNNFINANTNLGTNAVSFIRANMNFGISAVSSDNNSFAGNTITGNQVGIFVNASLGNSIYRNNITANDYAILIGNSIDTNSSYNTITENNITTNQVHIYIQPDAHNNSIYHNNFIDNTEQLSATDTGDYYYYWDIISINLANFWDNGSEGNYWSDYEDKYPNATELDSSGTWNTPYIINIMGSDNYPLMQPFTIPSFP